MAKIYNSECTKGLAQNAGIQQNVDKVPNELAEKIVPVFETNPELLRKGFVRHATLTADATLYTTPTNQDFYLTNIVLSNTKDAASDCSGVHISATINGANVRLCQITGITLTAGSMNISRTFKEPIKIDRGTNITVSHLTGAGAVLATYASIAGYLDESRA